MAKHKASGSPSRPRAAPGQRASAAAQYQKINGTAPPRNWNAARIARSNELRTPAPKPVAAQISKPVAVARPTSLSVRAPMPGMIQSLVASNAAHMAGTVLKGAARGGLVGIGVQAGLQAAVGAYRDGMRGAGRGIVDAVTLGFGSAAFDRKFGSREMSIEKSASEGMANTVINQASMVAAGYAGARVLSGGIGAGVAIGGGLLALSAMKSAAMRDFLSFKPETDKDIAERRRNHRNIDRMTEGTRYSERMAEKADSHENKALLGAGVKFAGYSTMVAGIGSLPAAAAGVTMATAGSLYEGHHERKATRARRTANAVDYFARRQRGDNTSGVPMVKGQNASIAFDKANRAFQNKTAAPPERAGEFYDRTRRDPRSGKTIHEKVRNPNH